MAGIQGVQQGFRDYPNNQGADPGDSRETWRHALLVSIPFLLVGAGSVFATYLPFDLWQSVPGVGMVLLLFGVFGVAWIRDFPRWSYPFILPLPGVALIGLVLAIVTGELINLFVPGVFAVTVAVAIAWSRSLRPLRQLVVGIWQDWTLLAFMMYGLLPVGISIVFDDAHYNNQTPYYALAVLAGVCGALLYLRCHQAWQRIVVLLGGVTLMVLMGLLDRVHFIGSQAYTHQASGWMFHVWLLLMWLITAPALTVGVSRYLVGHRRSA
jgi:hypothetical protein